MFKRKSSVQEEGVRALQELAASLGAIAQSLKNIEEVIPKINTIYEVYKDINPPKWSL